ncbi:MAG: hypothetical protein OXI12_06645 [Gammaproteobacteria bacterium]|nr:hypothetical protein [Gammaproteobacteria bacterium]
MEPIKTTTDIDESMAIDWQDSWDLIAERITGEPLYRHENRIGEWARMEARGYAAQEDLSDDMRERIEDDMISAAKSVCI